MSVIRKVSPFLLRDDRGFVAYLGPRQRPCSLGFRRPSWWAAEPDYPPSTLLRPGSPARHQVLDVLSVIEWGAVAGRGSWSWADW
jgi:hypothetical protein